MTVFGTPTYRLQESANAADRTLVSPVPLLPDPPALGFPPKFCTWREDQVAAIDRTIRTGKRFIAAIAPTGFGKTLYGVAAGLLHPGVSRVLYLTATRNLQDQLHTDFAAMGMVDIRGQRNYECTAVHKGGPLEQFRRHRGYVGCDDGPCHAGVRCTLAPDRSAPFVRPDCHYYGRVHDARGATLVSSNYAWWLAAGAYSQGIGAFDLLILDEAHHAADELETFLTFDLDTEDAFCLGSTLPDSEIIDQWRDWARHHHGRLQTRIEQLELMPPVISEAVTEMRRLKAVLLKLGRLKDVSPTDWIIERGDGRARFAPMRVGAYAADALYRGVPRVLLTSATLSRKTLQLLGIAPADAEILEFPSTFPVERRPVIAVETAPTVIVNARMHESTKVMWMRRIDRLIEARRDRKGLIHAISYTRAKEIFAMSEHRGLMIMHGSGEAKSALRAFEQRSGGAILISPSMETGIDLPYDLCRYQIIAKVPIPDTRGRIMQIRCDQDPELRVYLAMQRLVQMTGRIVRAADDWGETFIVDDTFGSWFFGRAKKHAPQWFIDAVEFCDTLPAPVNFM